MSASRGPNELLAETELVAPDLPVTEVLAVETSDRVLTLDACDARDLPDTEDGATDCALMLGRRQLPDLLETEDFGSDI